eukprot:6383523-Lingulodinium_polyedra.AAC.1
MPASSSFPQTRSPLAVGRAQQQCTAGLRRMPSLALAAATQCSFSMAAPWSDGIAVQTAPAPGPPAASSALRRP